MSLLTELINRDIRAVIFDLDDTLYPEIQYVKSGFKAVSKQIGKDYGIECYHTMIDAFHICNTNLYNRVLSQHGVEYDEEYIKKLIIIYRQHIPDKLEFFSDVQPFLKEIKNLGIKTGIITDGRIEGQKHKLSALGCYGLFDRIIISDELGGEQFRKPSKKAFEIICSDLKVGFNQTAYIGDNPAKDFYIGSEGVFTVRIKRDNALNFGGEEYYKGIKEKLLINSLL